MASMSLSTRIVVIGGGIVAASVACHLARRGADVVTVPRRQPANRTAGRRRRVAAGNGPEALTAGPSTGAVAAALALGGQPSTDLAPFDPARF
jgi:glycine/D-amino acid oxidase-like deaminating enzyme